ncbi:hypothetical protein CVT24_008761 [Panaeolus cyanescens]|uniref:Uncharacterized protein n=1 Tax=Panaeolus cyanescens TaxID=181874 RepID=A0A409YWZ2_9AGAR|nr:hypothetical protein CVT24_008761 [Panaeolus cyanescens]
MVNGKTMPLRGDRSAPTFDPARPRELKRYFADLEYLFKDCNITNEEIKIASAIRYVDFDTAELWEILPEFSAAEPKFSDFKKAVLLLYPDAEDSDRYSLQDLENCIAQARRDGMYSVADAAEYHRKFTAIAHFLKSKNRLSDIEANRKYITGFQDCFWHLVFNRLQLQHANHHPQDPWPINDVYNAVRFILQGSGNIIRVEDTLPSSSPAPSLSTLSPSIPFKSEDTLQLLNEIRSLKLAVESLKSNQSHRSSTLEAEISALKSQGNDRPQTRNIIRTSTQTINESLKSKVIPSVSRVQAEATPERLFKASREALPVAPKDPLPPSDSVPIPAKKSEPTNRHLPSFCNPELASRVADKFLDVPITITARDLLAVAPDLRSHVLELITTKTVVTKESAIVSVLQDQADPVEEEDEEDIGESTSTAILLNQEASDPPQRPSASHSHPVSVFSVNVAPDPIETNIRSLPQGQSPNSDRLEVAKDSYSLRSVEIQSPAYNIRLGRPFDVTSEAVVQNFRDGSQVMTLNDLNTGQAVTIPTNHCTLCCCHCNSDHPEEFTLDPEFSLSEQRKGASPILCLMICALILTLVSLLSISLALSFCSNLAIMAFAAIYRILWADLPPFSKQIPPRTSLSKVYAHSARFVALMFNLIAPSRFRRICHLLDPAELRANAYRLNKIDWGQSSFQFGGNMMRSSFRQLNPGPTTPWRRQE